MTVSRFTLLTFFMAFCMGAATSYAAESVDFIDKNSFQKPRIISLLSRHDFSSIASVDLNNDSIDEYVLSQTLDNNRYKFHVIAPTENGFIQLGAFTGRKLMVAYSENHGVRSILSFNDIDNDFQYDVYAWDAAHSTFKSERAARLEGAQ